MFPVYPVIKLHPLSFLLNNLFVFGYYIILLMYNFVRRGSMAIVPLVFVALAAAAALVFVAYPGPASVSVDYSPPSGPSPTLEPTSAPTLTPTPASSPTPTVKPSPTLIPKPTLPPVSGPPGAGLTRASVSTPKGNFSATIVSFDMANTRIITDTGNDDNCATGCVTMPLANYVARNGGFAAVNGTYFCPAAYPDCSGKTDSFDFPVYNTRLTKWINADKLSWQERRAIFYVDGSGAHYLNNSSGFGGGLSAGIINFPGLVDGGNVQIDDNQSGLSEKQKARNTKVGIGVRDSQHVMVVVANSVTMQEFAYVFKSLGATGALNLDTGGSTALIYGGRYVYGPGRNLPNAVIFASK
jgi:hypothetical protein